MIDFCCFSVGVLFYHDQVPYLLRQISRRELLNIDACGSCQKFGDELDSSTGS